MTADEHNIRHARAGALRSGAGRTARAALRRVVGRLVPALRRARAREQALATTVGRLEGEVAALRERHTEQIERLEDFVRDLIVTVESLRREAEDAQAVARAGVAMVQPLTAELHALPYMDESPFESMTASVGEVLGYGPAAGLTGAGADYAIFEDLFRGPAERVAESQRPYLALVRDHQPVLDIGCGRGEFLGLLAVEGVTASGVDSDAGMVARCRERGLDVTRGDVNEHLQGLPDGSLGTIFSAQVIEHLPHLELKRLLELALAKLAPGGLFIAETVNPHRIASLKNFWVDLTHQHPIFPEVALASCAIAGFPSGYVFAPGFESFEQARFQAPAYAVVAAAGPAGAA
jgi:SAM-dependent methyltransferase